MNNNVNNNQGMNIMEQNAMMLAQMQQMMQGMMQMMNNMATMVQSTQVNQEVALSSEEPNIDEIHSEVVGMEVESNLTEPNTEVIKLEVPCNTQDLKEDMKKMNIQENLMVQAEVKLEEGLAQDIRGVDMRDMDYSKLSKLSDEKKLILKSQLRDAIFNGGIENVASVCNQYPTELLQQYLISLMCANNTYHAEFTNIDSFSREEIISSIDEINFENFKEVMEKKGIIVKEPTEGQINKLKELGVTKMPKTSFGASEIIKSFVGATDNTPSQAQIKRINSLVERLGLQGEEITYKTKYEASKIISELQAKADEVLGEEPATKSQIEYYGRLLKACNKRLTKERKEFAHSCTKKQISEEIEKLKEEYKVLNPYVTEGQVKYLVSLHQMLMLSYNVEDIKMLTKEEGTKLIDKLKREQLFMETRRYQASLTMKAIQEMTSEQVTEMLNQIARDKKDSKVK